MQRHAGIDLFRESSGDDLRKVKQCIVPAQSFNRRPAVFKDREGVVIRSDKLEPRTDLSRRGWASSKQNAEITFPIRRVPQFYRAVAERNDEKRQAGSQTLMLAIP